MALPKQSGFNFHDHAADPTVDGDLLRNKEELKPFLEGAVQKLVMLRYPGVNPGLNQLRNPSFEVDADGVSPPTGWTRNNVSSEVDNAEFYDGAKSVKHSGAGAAGVRQIIAAKKGQYVRISLACKTSTASLGYLEMKVGVAWQPPVYHSGGGTWEILTDIYGPLAVDADITFYNGKAAAADDVWCDQAVLQVFDAPFFDHAAEHENGGDDEISVTGLNGLLADCQTPCAHDLDSHNPCTLAELSADVSDATLIDTADARLSDARTPTAHALGGAEHSADTLANLNSKVSDATLLATGQATKYVVRDATTIDKTLADFTTDGNWHVNGLDLSAIVPAGAIAVQLEIIVTDNALSHFYIRRDATNTFNRLNTFVQVVNRTFARTGMIAINSDRLLDYLASNVTWTTIGVTVVGYVMPT